MAKKPINKPNIDPKNNRQVFISDDKKMQRIYEKLVERYAPALKKLADG